MGRIKPILRGGTIKLRTLLLLITLALSVVVFVTVGNVLYWNTTSVFDRELAASEQINQKQLANELDIHINNFLNLSNIIAGNSRVQQALLHLEQTGSGNLAALAGEHNAIYDEIVALMASLNTCYDGIESMLLLTADRVYPLNTTSLMTYDFQTLYRALSFADDESQMIRTQGEALITDRQTQQPYFLEGQTVIVRTMAVNNRPLAVLVLKLSDAWLEKQLPEDAYVQITFGGEPVYQSRVARESQGAVEETQPLSAKGWELRYQLPQSSNSRMFIALFLIFLVISFLLSLLIGNIALRRMLTPLDDVLDGARRFQRGDDPAKARVPIRRLRYTLTERIMLIFLGAILLPLILFGTTYLLSTLSLFSQELHLSKQSAFEQIGQNMQTMMHNRESELQAMVFDTQLQSYLLGAPAGDANDDFVMLQPYLSIFGQYYNLTIYDMKHVQLYATLTGAGASVPLKTLLAFDKTHRIFQWYGSLRSGTEIPLISLATKIVNVSEESSRYFLRQLGTAVLDLQQHQIADLFALFTGADGMEIYLVDADRTILSAASPALLRQTLPSPDAGVVEMEAVLGTTGWRLLGQYRAQDVRQSALTFLYEHLHIILLTAIILIFLAFELSHIITSPLHRLVRRLEQVRLQNQDQSFPADTNIAEINRLGEAFNEMLSRIDALLEEKVASRTRQETLQREKQEMELLSLQSQINPHFLCNALDLVRCLSDQGDAVQASEMLKQISNLFRYGLTQQEPLITVGQELKYAKAYASIMSARFPGRIRFIWDVDPSLASLPFIKMLLQPLLENAVEHAILPQKKPGTVTVRFSGGSTQMCVAVTDDGAGMEAESLALLLQRIHLGQVDAHIGLRNVYRRLKLFYGDDARLNITSQYREGTTVSIEIDQPQKLAPPDEP